MDNAREGPLLGTFVEDGRTYTVGFRVEMPGWNAHE